MRPDVIGIYPSAMSRPLTRRSLLTAAAALGLAPLTLTPRSARAFGDASRFIPSLAQHGGSWDARASGLRRLAWELQRRTSVDVLPEARPVPLASPLLFQSPFLYLGGEGALPALGEAELANLRRYLTFGGFILADSNDGVPGSPFDASLRRELSRLMPRAQLRPLPDSHVVFKSFYLLDGAFGRVQVKPQLEALFMGQRAAVIYSQNDLAGAWARDEGGSYAFDVSPGGERQRELSFRLGINLCMYALCLDYKDDAVHLEHILSKRR